MKQLVVAAALVAGWTQSGTGVELIIDASSITLDQLVITASYDGQPHTHSVAVAAGATLDLLAQLPDESTTVTFDVTAQLAAQPVAHGVSSAIAITAHHIVSTTIALLAGGGSDGFVPPDLAGDGGGPGW